jgi:hypothetical protein
MTHANYSLDEKRKIYPNEYHELMNTAIGSKGCRWSRHLLIHDTHNYVILRVNCLVYDENNENWDFLYGNLTVLYITHEQTHANELWAGVGF